MMRPVKSISYKFNPVNPKLASAWFLNPWTYQVISWFSSLCAFTCNLYRYGEVRDNREAQEEFRAKGLGQPLCNLQTMEFFVQANRKHVKMMKRVKDFSGIVSFMQKLADQKRARSQLDSDKRIKGIQGKDLKSLRTVDLGRIVNEG
jgi:hypothetical protein